MDYTLDNNGKRVPFIRPAKVKKQAAVKIVAPTLAIDKPSLEELEGAKLQNPSMEDQKVELDGSETNKDLKLMLDDLEVKYPKSANKEKLLELLAPYILVVAVEEEPEL